MRAWHDEGPGAARPGPARRTCAPDVRPDRYGPVRPVSGAGAVRDWDGNLEIGHLDEGGIQLRPHIVWFGEEVPMIERAAREMQTADAVIIVGTSLQVYPAAGLVGLTPDDVPIIYIDPHPTVSYEMRGRKDIHVLEMGGSEGMREATRLLSELL